MGIYRSNLKDSPIIVTMALGAEEVAIAAQMLAERIVAEVENWKKAGRLVLRKQKYTLRPNFSLHYTVDPTVIDFEAREGEEDSWDGENWENFWTHQIEPLAEYKNFLQLAKPQSEQPNLIRWFASKVASDIAFGYESAAIDENVSAITRDLVGEEQEYKVTIWLQGIRLAEETVSISDSFLLREPTRADLQEKVLERHTHYWHAIHRPTNFSSIAELRIRTSRRAAVQRLVDRYITALRLFRLGSVSTSRYQVSSNSFSTLANFVSSGREQYPRKEYELSTRDAPRLSRFLAILTPLIPTPYEAGSQGSDYMATALQWYSEALLVSTPVEGIVACAVACLEALFLGDNPSSEIAHRLAQRTALLFRQFGSAPVDTLATIKLGYDVRSRHVHGAAPKKIPRPKLDELSSALCEYARLGCLIWLQFTGLHRLDRADLLQKISLALVDDNAREQLNQWCRAIEFGRTERVSQ